MKTILTLCLVLGFVQTSFAKVTMEKAEAMKKEMSSMITEGNALLEEANKLSTKAGMEPMAKLKKEAGQKLLDKAAEMKTKAQLMKGSATSDMKGKAHEAHGKAKDMAGHAHGKAHEAHGKAKDMAGHAHGKAKSAVHSHATKSAPANETLQEKVARLKKEGKDSATSKTYSHDATDVKSYEDGAKAAGATSAKKGFLCSWTGFGC